MNPVSITPQLPSLKCSFFAYYTRLITASSIISASEFSISISIPSKKIVENISLNANKFLYDLKVDFMIALTLETNSTADRK
jgi:hypothetical protein